MQFFAHCDKECKAIFVCVEEVEANTCRCFVCVPLVGEEYNTGNVVKAQYIDCTFSDYKNRITGDTCTTILISV